MTETESLQRFGVSPTREDLPAIREVLSQQTELNRQTSGAADTLLMKLACVQLFCVGQLEDVLPIWRAKTSSMDADGSIDIQLLCSAGLQNTETYLSDIKTDEANDALLRLKVANSSGDFQDFDPADFKAFWQDYYSNPMS